MRYTVRGEIRCGAVRLLVGVLGWVGLVGCGGPEAGAWEEQALGQQSQASVLTNGLSANGLSANGLSANGLSANGLSTGSFGSWFNNNAAQGNEVMSYVVWCAMSPSQSLSYTASNGVPYTWTGGLGLAPGWAAGNAATVAEQQVVSACLAAHVNTYGAHVNISVLGQDGQGNAIGYSAQELVDYAQKEGCFFGNLFNGAGTFSGNDGLSLGASQSSARVCALSGGNCAPLTYTGASCSSLCTRAKDALGNDLPYYSSCTYGGTTYKPLVTRMRLLDIGLCGNGVCEGGEKAGMLGYCAADCG